MALVVDLDDVSTWPSGFRSIVERVAERASEEEWHGGSADEGDALRALADHRLRAYHCTRLTPREVESVRTAGLQPLSTRFTGERIANAVADGHLSAEEAVVYSKTDLPRSSSRADRVWLFTDRSALAIGPQVGYLLEVWGGEGINQELEKGSPEMQRLESVGTPTVVVASLDLGIHYRRGGPGLLAAAVQQLRCGSGGTNVQCEITLAPAYIEAIHHPGSDFWARLVWTPRTGFRSG